MQWGWSKWQAGGIIVLCFLVRRTCYTSLVGEQVTTLHSTPVFYKWHLCDSIVYKYTVMSHNEPDNSNIWCNRCNLYGTLCIDGAALSACAEQMLIVPAAALIMTGIIVIELLSHCCARAELHGLTRSLLFQTALGRGVTADRKDRATHQRAPIRLFWNIYDPCCFLGKPKNPNNKHFTSSSLFFSHKFNLAAANRSCLDKDVAHYIYAALSSCPFEQVPVSESPLLCTRTHLWGGE